MKNKLLCILLLLSSTIYGQIEQFDYQRSIEKPSSQWHKIELPNSIFSKINTNFSDIRIFGITENNDTLETPFLIKTEEETIENKAIKFKQINVSHNNKGYYYTFKISTKDVINELNLDFNQSNFDWQIDVEGSQNQQEWFMISKDYRIVSIQNQWTNYQFSKVVFSDAKYRYLRLLIKSKTDPKLITTHINKKVITEGKYQNRPIKSQQITNNKKTKQTIINLNLGMAVSVNSLDLKFSNTVDYYRRATVQYLADSFETDKGRKYSYNTLTTGMLSSIEKGDFKFKNTILQQLKITIENNDNTPLKLEKATVNGTTYQLIGRFSEPADYTLYYGSDNRQKPNYDINQFTDKIPTSLVSLKLDKEVTLQKTNTENTNAPLFENEMWLWTIMVLIIGLLGWFSFKMLKKAA